MIITRYHAKFLKCWQIYFSLCLLSIQRSLMLMYTLWKAQGGDEAMENVLVEYVFHIKHKLFFFAFFLHVSSCRKERQTENWRGKENKKKLVKFPSLIQSSNFNLIFHNFFGENLFQIIFIFSHHFPLHKYSKPFYIIY